MSLREVLTTGIELLAGRVVSTVIPKNRMLSRGALGKGYEQNPYRRFHSGDMLVFKKGTADYKHLQDVRIEGFSVKGRVGQEPKRVYNLTYKVGNSPNP